MTNHTRESNTDEPVVERPVTSGTTASRICVLTCSAVSHAVDADQGDPGAMSGPTKAENLRLSLAIALAGDKGAVRVTVDLDDRFRLC